MEGQNSTTSKHIDAEPVLFVNCLLIGCRYVCMYVCMYVCNLTLTITAMYLAYNLIPCNTEKLSWRLSLFKQAVKEGLNDFVQGTDESEEKERKKNNNNKNNINKLGFSI